MIYRTRHKRIYYALILIIALQFFSLIPVNATDDNTAPVITITPAEGRDIKKSYTITVTVEDEGSGLGDVKFQYFWSRSSTPDERLSLSTGVILSNEAENVSIPTPMWVGSDRVEGEFYLHSKSQDLAGNTNVKTAGPFCLDNLGPTITLESESFGQTCKEPSVRVFAYDYSLISSMQARWLNTETYQYEPRTYYPKSGSEIAAPNTPGSYMLTVTAYDKMNNSGSSKPDWVNPIIVGTPDGSPELMLDTDNDTGDAFAMRTAAVSAVVWDDKDLIDDMTILHKWTQDPDVQPTAWDTDGYDISYGGYLDFRKNDGNGMWYLWVKVEDTDGNKTIKCSEGIPLDTKAPELSVEYFPKGPTSDTVTAFVYSDESLSQNSFGPWDNYCMNGMFCFDSNGEYTLYASDLVFNLTETDFEVSNVDPSLPKADITYSTYDWTSETVTASVYAPDNCILQDLPEGFTVTSTDQSGNAVEAYYVFDTNGGVEFKVKDMDTGTVGWDAACVCNIDKTPPVIKDISYYPDKLTCLDVTATVAAVDLESGLSAGYWDAYEYEFSQNGSHTFTIEDYAGNSAQRTAQVDWIDKEPIEASIDYESTGSPYDTVTASLDLSGIPGEVHMIQPESGTSHVFTENGTYQFIFQDEAGHTGTALAEVSWIGEYVAGANITYDVTSATNQPVTATINFADPGVVVTNNGGNKSYTFNDNGTFTFEYEDGSGNTGSAQAAVTWIDKELSAEPSIDYSTENLTNQDVTAAITFAGSDEITVEGGPTYTFTENGAHTFVFRDQAGNTGNLTAEVTWIDKELPTGTVEYDIAVKTQPPVKATLHTDDNVGPVTITSGSSEHIFEDNSQYIFTFTDGAGNAGSVTAEVYWIDKEAPVGEISYDIDSLTNKNVTAAISFQEPGVQITNNGGNNTYTFTENGSFIFQYRDEAGNVNSTEARVDWIDKEPPTGALQYTPDTATNGSVKATLTVNDNKGPVTIISGSSEHVFEDNGEYTFTFIDEAGNTNSIVAKVDWIDRTPANALISYDIDTFTKDQVTATISFDEPGVTVTNNGGLCDYSFNENGTFTFEYIDLAGNRGTAEAGVDWIDKEPPSADIVYSTTLWTGGSVEAGLENIYDNNGQAVQVIGDSTFVFEQNGSHSFCLQDSFGNQAEITAIVTWIDKQLPAPVFNYSEHGLTNLNVSCRITFNTASGNEAADHDQITILNNNGSDTYTFTENGAFTFEYEDQFGNTGTAEAKVDIIDKTSPVIDVAFDNTEMTSGNVMATITVSEDNGFFIKSDQTGLEAVDENTLRMVFDKNSTYNLKVADYAGNVSEKDITVDWIDKEAPAVNVVFSTTDSTKENVTVTVYFTDACDNVVILTKEDELPEYVESLGQNQYLFKDNGSFVLKYVDTLGNAGETTLSVSWIDREIVPVMLEYSNTNESPYSVVAWLRSYNESNPAMKIYDENGNEVAGDNIYKNSMCYVFKKNETHQFVYYDVLGNRGEVAAKVTWIQEIQPSVHIHISPISACSTNVVTKLVLDNGYGRGFNITNNGGSDQYEFTENGSFTFEYENDAGLKGTKKVTVDWIDREPPVIDRIEYVPGGDVPRPAQASNIIFHLHDNSRDTPYTESFPVDENGDYKFNMKDNAGNSLTVPVKVDWIDREVPQITVKKSTEQFTNGDVTVTISANEDVMLRIGKFTKTGNSTIYQNGYSDRHTITVSGNCRLQLDYWDNAGNSAWGEYVDIDNIDKQAPTLKLLRVPVFVTDIAGQPVWEMVKPWITASDNMLGDMTDDVSMTLKDTEWSGQGDEIRSYELSVEDKAGNSSVTIPITVVIAEERYFPAVLINGNEVSREVTVELPEGESTASIQTDFLGLKGEYTVKLIDGERTSGYFKSAFNAPVYYDSRIIGKAMDPLKLGKGVYTLYVCDQEMAGRSIVIRVE